MCHVIPYPLPIQPRSQGVLTSYADHEAEWTPWYILIKSAQNMGRLAAIMDLQFARQRWLCDLDSKLQSNIVMVVA